MNELSNVDNKKVYFIFQEGDDSKCKIGKSKDVADRVKQLQTGNPNKLYVYRDINGYTSEENEIHKMLYQYRIDTTEWFNINKHQVDHFLNDFYLPNKAILNNIKNGELIVKLVKQLIKESPTNDESYEQLINSFMEDSSLAPDEVNFLCLGALEIKSLVIKTFVKHKTIMSVDDRKTFLAEVAMFASKLEKISKPGVIQQKIKNWNFH